VCEDALLFNRKSTSCDDPLENWGKGDKTSPDVQTATGHFVVTSTGVFWVSQFQSARLQRSEFSREPASTQDGCSTDTDFSTDSDFFPTTSHPVANLHKEIQMFLSSRVVDLMPPMKLPNNFRPYFSTIPAPTVCTLVALLACLLALRCAHRQ
jgi:hypothetical protein